MNTTRRRHARITVKAGDVHHPDYTCLDLSESGMKFSSREKVGVGQTITAEIRALDTPLSVRCKIMWCREATSLFESGFQFGVMFENLSVRDLTQLRELIDSRLT